MRNFKELIVWQKSVDLVADVYNITKKFPEEEKYGLISQMRRAAVSIPSNISEGHMRTTDKDFRHFLGMARGSCAELETQFFIAEKLKYIDLQKRENVLIKVEEVSKMLSSLSSKL